MSYYSPQRTMYETAGYPVSNTVGTILGRRNTTYARSTTPEPRSVLGATGHSMFGSRMDNVRDRIAR